MTQVNIKAWVDAWVTANPKVWEHDRSSTLGASETGGCLRKAFFSKHQPSDADLTDDDYGFKVRGDIIERHLWLPAIEHAVRNSNTLTLIGAGDEQVTLNSGFISATPDGLLTGVDRDCLSYLDIDDIGPDRCLLVEAKSIDPRSKLLEPKPEHVFQVQVQMGLLREVTDYRPEYALISYIDASQVSKIVSWPVRFDPAAYDAAKRRAREVFAAESAADLPPEGRIEGGCKYCPFTGPCNQLSADAVPQDKAEDLPAVVLKNFGELVMMESAWRREKTNAEKQLALTQESIRQMLRENRTRAASAAGWTVSLARVNGRRVIDVKALTEAAQAAGIDVSQFERQSNDGDRLTVKTLGDKGDDD